MAKKKEAPIGIALFDDEAPVSKTKKQEASKQTSKESKKEVKPKTSKPSKETKSSPKEDKNSKKETKPAKKNVDKDIAGNTSSGRNRTGNKRNTVKKEDKEDGGRKSKGTPDSSKKSRKSSKADTKNTSSSKQPRKKSDESSKHVKGDTDKGPDRRDKAVSDTSTKITSRSTSEEQTAANTASTSVDVPKKRKHKFTRGTEIWAPKQITGKPRAIKDGELLAIEVDGELLEVSPWSIKNGIYRQGMDSNYLVKYLHYETVATKYDASNEELSNIVKKKEGN